MLSTLQIIWFLLVGVLLIGYAILDGFDLGVGLWHLFSHDDKERTTFLNSIRPVWDGNEVWLLTGGGALFAAFPPVYASVFSGFYLALMLVLLGLIFRAVAIDFRDKIDTPNWKKTWDVAFALGSFLPALLFGVAVGNIVRGLNLDEQGNYLGTFFALLNPYSLVCGIFSLTMFATHGALYLAMKTSDSSNQKARKWAQTVWNLYPVLFIVLSTWSFISFTREMLFPSLILSVLSLVGIGSIKFFMGREEDQKAFLASCFSIALIMLSIGAHLFPYLLPSTSTLNSGLTIFNSSSSEMTLGVMLIIALIGMPIVIFYTTYLYRIFKGKANAESLY